MARIQVQTMILPVLVYLLARQRTKPIEDTVPLDQYDYIIVGGGAAGSVLANRLSQDESVKVLLVEAGPKDNVTTEVPALTIMLQETEYDWMDRTTQQENSCLSSINKKCTIPSGKVIGGGSSIGIMSTCRGHKGAFDAWEKAGTEEWSFDKLLPYFKKFENDQTKGDCVESEFHGCGGEVTYTEPQSMANITKAAVESLKGNNFQEVDINSGKIADKTYNKQVYPIKDGMRVSAPNAFLKPIQNRPNLHIALNTLVTKILIDPDTKEATGVELERKGESGSRQVKATKEVILSAGAFRSPQLLMLSGIGPKEDLEKLSIPVIVDHPGVGQNLKDFSSSVVVMTADRDLLKEELELIGRSSISQWAKGKGPMASPSGTDVISFVKSTQASSDAPDLTLIFQSLPLLSISAFFFKVMSGLSDKTWDSAFEPLVDKPSAFIHVTLMQPKSTGYVKINSKNAHDAPEINPNYLAVESDLIALAEGMDKAISLTKHDAYKNLNFVASNMNVEECKAHEPLSHDYHKCLAKHITFTKWGYCCTNKMGPDSDPKNVVDNRLRVKNVKRLRVVDSSVFPDLVNGFPEPLVYAVAEKAATMIKEDNK